MIGGATYIFGALIYVMRVPERWYPRTFDTLGTSHNIHHLTVIIGFTVMFNESMRLFLSRKSMVCPAHLTFE